MVLNNSNSIIFIPDNTDTDLALERTTQLAIAAHHDDIEIMAYSGIAQCFQNSNEFFSGVVVSDGANSARSGAYTHFSDEDMNKVRILEQKKAAVIGEYSAQIMLNYRSNCIKDKNNNLVVQDIKNIIEKTKPDIIYTHNLADKHATHCAVAIKVIQAIRAIAVENRPKKLYGCEVWRDLDWVCDNEKVVLDTSSRDNLAKSLISVFDSQIAGGKRYDLAVEGRRRANATYCDSHSVDSSPSINYAIDLTPLILDTSLDIKEYILAYITRFNNDVAAKIDSILGD